MVANAGKVANAAAADEHDRVLLQVVAFTRDVRDDFAAVGQADLGDLAKRRVRLLRGGRIDAGADAALLRVLLHRRDLGLGLLRFAALADQLIDCGHVKTSPVVLALRQKVKDAGTANAKNGKAGPKAPPPNAITNRNAPPATFVTGLL